jgi:integrase
MSTPPSPRLRPSSLRFHDLRHAAASRLIAAGVDDAVVADQLGHGDSRITRSTYAHVYDRREKMAAVRAALQGVVEESAPADLT